jgi:hypothetical protein
MKLVSGLILIIALQSCNLNKKNITSSKSPIIDKILQTPEYYIEDMYERDNLTIIETRVKGYDKIAYKDNIIYFSGEERSLTKDQKEEINKIRKNYIVFTRP